MTTEGEMRTTMQDEPVMDEEQRKVALGMDWGARDPADSLAYVWCMVGGGKTDRLPALVSVAHIPARTCTWLADLVEAQP
jgi:hypothetical protein